MRSSNWPETPTKGRPSRSSSAPGASPISIRPDARHAIGEDQVGRGLAQRAGVEAGHGLAQRVQAVGGAGEAAAASRRAAAARRARRAGAPGARAAGRAGAAAGPGRRGERRPRRRRRAGAAGGAVERRRLQRLVGAPVELQPQRRQQRRLRLRLHRRCRSRPALSYRPFRAGSAQPATSATSERQNKEGARHVRGASSARPWSSTCWSSAAGPAGPGRRDPAEAGRARRHRLPGREGQRDRRAYPLRRRAGAARAGRADPRLARRPAGAGDAGHRRPLHAADRDPGLQAADAAADEQPRQLHRLASAMSAAGSAPRPRRWASRSIRASPPPRRSSRTAR